MNDKNTTYIKIHGKKFLQYRCQCPGRIDGDATGSDKKFLMTQTVHLFRRWHLHPQTCPRREDLLWHCLASSTHAMISLRPQWGGVPSCICMISSCIHMCSGRFPTSSRSRHVSINPFVNHTTHGRFQNLQRKVLISSKLWAVSGGYRIEIEAVTSTPIFWSNHNLKPTVIARERIDHIGSWMEATG